jgi:hypothetical protein
MKQHPSFWNDFNKAKWAYLLTLIVIAYWIGS